MKRKKEERKKRKREEKKRKRLVKQNKKEMEKSKKKGKQGKLGEKSLFDKELEFRAPSYKERENKRG